MSKDNKPDARILQDLAVPRMIQLTVLGNPDVDDGRPTTVYIDPRLIATISRRLSSWIKYPGRKNEEGTDWERHPFAVCTVVDCQGGHQWLVLESVDEVARRRDAAFYHTPGLTAVESTSQLTSCPKCGRVVFPSEEFKCRIEDCGMLPK